ncbi:MAG: response regulator transcription factor [Defluviitaleaceae bacterium]|nr:response regulator transcription factor [Defluviitaleaceae bacterium]MCL2239090.1 response regulator transcription factor [Defluviitaleaceae bacterium]
MQKMLIADDNRQIVSVLSEYAKKDGFEVTCAYDGGEALDIAEAVSFDMILLDVMMPGMDGFAICKAIRKASNVPIIMITARGEDFERIMGLDNGADDYIVKPFSPGEVMARVRAVLRRLGDGGKVFNFGGLTVSLEKYTVHIDGQPISLTKKETELLYTLGTNKDKVFSRDKLLDGLWGYDYLGDARTVDTHIKRLRAKLSALPHPGWEIVTVWGAGYKFDTSGAGGGA